MKQTINFRDFRDAPRAYDRMDNFSYEGQRVLFDYMEDINPDRELDVIALCCDYAENDAETIAQDYNIDITGADGDTDAINDIVREYLEENTSIVGETPHGFVYAQFQGTNMIHLTKLPAHEAEAIAYAEGFTAAAQLFARIADLEAENDRLRDVDEENYNLRLDIKELQNELAATTAKLSQWQDEAARLANLAAKAMHKAKK